MSRAATTITSLAALGLLLAGCEPARICGPGTRAEGDDCVAEAEICGSGTVWDGVICVSAGDAGPTDTACVPDCEGRMCGLDGCGGSCGTCASGTTCAVGGQCVQPGCVGSCALRACGDDGCGGSCGSCDDPAAPFCEAGQCVAECVPDCLGKGCGPDGCGGSCGSCEGGHGCSPYGHCVPDGWSCDDKAFDAGDHCDCGCGAADPDCAVANLATLGCDAFHRCVDGGCESLVPAAWTCDPLHYDDGVYCDCGCGTPDPDCAEDDAFVLGCGPGEACGGDGTCEPCVASCDGKSCGNDGCGGSCGSCGVDADSGETLACIDNACILGCSPSPVLCETHGCGDDGCGGSCGSCPTGSSCHGGQCLVDPGMSCAGNCGIAAPGGCQCDATCVTHGDCCPDYVDACACLGDCGGKSCGDDGCGGSCGECGDPSKPHCGPTHQCEASCTPSCDAKACGDDGCGGSCGQCAAGEICNGSALCVPEAWTCAAYSYGEGALCDCSCGAPDPDCATIGGTMGCPLSTRCVTGTGVCDVAFCAADAACPSPKWCVGRYPAGNGALKGVCMAPNPAGAAPGEACVTQAGCATEVCAAGRCRHHCQLDGECRPGESCVGVPQLQPLTGKPLGVLSVCDRASAIDAACASQADCAGDGGSCLALVHPVDHGVLLRCGVVDADGGQAEGAPCDALYPCAIGLVCADGVCGRACPAGAGDCPVGQVCDTHLLYPAPASDPDGSPTVQACSAL